MSRWHWLLKPKHRLDLVAGLCDGILTALTPASGRLLNAATPMDLSLALRVATASAVSGGFILFMAHYADTAAPSPGRSPCSWAGCCLLTSGSD